MIDMNKKYTSAGQPVRILCTDANGIYPVVALHESGCPMNFNLDGTQPTSPMFNLIEVSPYADFKIDEPVMVRDQDHQSWLKRHFAGICSIGRPKAFDSGCTSWSTRNSDVTAWNHCRRPTAEELAS